MRSVVDERLRSECKKYALRFTCESCAHYDPASLTCANGFPTGPHRNVDLTDRAEVVFCKLFELG